MIRIIPVKPTITALHRQKPTWDLRSGIDNAVKKKGLAKAKVEAVANSSVCKAK